MKIMHLSDLHLGKKMENYSLEEDQAHILEEIVQIAAAEKPDCILIAGDVFDKSSPAVNAITMFDNFLSRLADLEIPTLIDSGNHDSNERLAYGGWAMQHSGIHIAPLYDGTVSPLTLEDEFGPVRFWLLPFIRPMQVRDFFADQNTDTYDDAFAAAIGAIPIDPSERNVLVAHQYVAGAVSSDSEETIIGNVECVSPEHFKAFDYTALGHLHTPQDVTSPRIHYCGTPLKYSYSERISKKSVSIIELGKKGDALDTKAILLHPLHDLREVCGSFAELMEMPYTDDFVFLKLTDPQPILNAQEKLRTRFGRIMQIDYVERDEAEMSDSSAPAANPQHTPYEVFAEFFQKYTGKEMTPEQDKYITQLIQEIWEVNHETNPS